MELLYKVCPETARLAEEGSAHLDDYYPEVDWKVAQFATRQEAEDWVQAMGRLIEYKEEPVSSPYFETAVRHRANPELREVARQSVLDFSRFCAACIRSGIKVTTNDEADYISSDGTRVPWWSVESFESAGIPLLPPRYILPEDDYVWDEAYRICFESEDEA